jgi:hypothetical protein
MNPRRWEKECVFHFRIKRVKMITGYKCFLEAEVTGGSKNCSGG